MQACSRSAAIAAELRDDILRGQYRSGERLPSERDLAGRYGVHRGAIREAMKRLEQLGIARTGPGGARVAPIHEASLDVVQHLIELEDPPDPNVVDQVIEVLGGLFSNAARLCAERATDEQRVEIHRILAKAKGELPADERASVMEELGDLFVEASGNMVLKLVRRGVRTDFMEKMTSRRPELIWPFAPTDLHFKELAIAIDQKNGPAAAEAVHQIILEIRRHAIDSITNERKRLHIERPSS
jgi:DNA-binding FadR family transcriptional regulator